MPTGYREIAAALRTAIEAGTHQPGDRLPTEHTLAAEYGVSRETVRRALAALKTAGLVVTATSQGTIVARPPVRVALTHYAGAVDPGRDGRDLGPWETACAEQGVPSRVEVLDVDRGAAPADVVRRLELPADAEVVCRRRRMYAGDDVAQVQESWTPVDVATAAGLDRPGKVVGGIYAALTASGVELATATEEVTGRGPTADEQHQLDLPDAGMVLEIWRTTRDRAGRPVELLHSVADARRVARVYDRLPLG